MEKKLILKLDSEGTKTLERYPEMLKSVFDNLVNRQPRSLLTNDYKNSYLETSNGKTNFKIKLKRFKSLGKEV